jgi:hypothetical protein
MPAALGKIGIEEMPTHFQIGLASYGSSISVGGWHQWHKIQESNAAKLIIITGKRLLTAECMDIPSCIYYLGGAISVIMTLCLAVCFCRDPLTA